MAKEPSKEATLNEVLAEVSLADVGVMLKSGLALIGCWGVVIGVAIVVGAASDSVGLNVPDWATWLFWFLVAWGVVHAATAEKSFHELEMSLYFPRMNWFGSLVLATYLAGLVFLFRWLGNAGKQDLVASSLRLLVFYGYCAPLLSFLAVIDHGHKKLMAKRRDETGAADKD